MLAQFRAAFVALVLFTVITGVVYPLAVTGVAQVLFPRQANGSLIKEDDKVVGSSLIGQAFEDPKYFWGRPSATNPGPPYDASSSSGSNLGPTNPDLVKAIQERVAALKEADPDNTAPIPVDLATASGSGLDPHITIAAAEYQSGRVSRIRALPLERVRKLIAEHTEQRTFGLLGEPRVNVLELNRALDKLD
jgi:K+-transporting ATPase ATPase C chain